MVDMISEKFKLKLRDRRTVDLREIRNFIEYELDIRADEELTHNQIHNPIYRELIDQGKI